jgi:hypothetical protein
MLLNKIKSDMIRDLASELANDPYDPEIVADIEFAIEEAVEKKLGELKATRRSKGGN